MRDLNQEFRDNEFRRYAYRFDYLMHGFMLRTFEGLLPQGRALELGCFEGEFTKRLAPFYNDLTVVEGASELVEAARLQVGGSVQFIHDRFENFQPSEKFDAIFLLHTLEHIDEPVALLRRIETWLTPRGRLFVAVPNAYAASRQIAVSMGLIAHPTAVTEGERLHGHRRTYSLSSLQEGILTAGLDIVACGGILFKPLANFQFDQLLENGTITNAYLDGCFDLGKRYPDLCASVYTVCAPRVGTVS